MGFDLAPSTFPPVGPKAGRLAVPIATGPPPASGCVAILCCLLAVFGQALGVGPPRAVTLSWDANSETDIAGYRLRYGTTTGVYDQNLDVGNTTHASILNLANGTPYFFVVSAYNT